MAVNRELMTTGVPLAMITGYTERTRKMKSRPTVLLDAATAEPFLHPAISHYSVQVLVIRISAYE
jgi:hypothetical protein